MPPAKKKPVARKTAQRPAPPIPASSDAPVIGILCGREVEMLPINKWRKSAMQAIQLGDLETWAESCLTDDGLDVWDELDPTMEEVGEFFASFNNEMLATQAEMTATARPNRAQRRATGRR
ncbi:hypothetical protein [Streptomyces glomeratus]|uniref:Uncharacterized protein n=1 Tax=Streptomyces glomeratus TaxID=284452 RepID=A0ABP6LDU2_9ACTN|nr:hypothetical protein [Streptomyces glomeratus]MCF1507048.1 hypothetical protein [Streptomyces glomeratus]